MQMPNATPQGIAGLMQQRPQQPQMPSPAKASPMAGLGGVDDRVSAYMGNTKPLEQRYAMSQDLLDLLALQKIKSQKEAAAREMQLQMAQQQAQSGEANMTVAQQREKEVTDLTKNELAQQRGDTAQQQTQQQQAQMQKMMSGIAGAPGANAAAQPKAMAAGGIVGYAGGGEILDKARERRKAAQQKMYSYGLNQRRQDPEGFQAAQEELQAAQAALQAAEKGYAAEMSAAGIDKPISAASPMGAVGRFEKAQASPAAPDAALAGAGRGAINPPLVDPNAPVPPAAKLPPANVVAAAAQNPAAPKPPVAPAAPPGLPSLQPGVVGPANDFGTKLEAAALKNAQIDPEARQLSEEERITKKMAPTPEQRKVYEEGIGGLQKMYDEQYDPERLRQEGLKRALIGAGGRRYGEFAGAASAGMNYDDQMRAAKLKEFGDVQKARTGLIDIDRAAVKGGIEAGSKAYEQGSLSQRQGLESGSRMYGEDVKSRDSLYSIDVGSRDKALDREIEKLKVKAQQDATAATRENLSYDKARTVYSATLGKVQELERRLDDDFAKTYGMLLMAEQSGKMDAAQRNQLETAKIQLQQHKAKIRREMEPVLDSARSKLGVSSSDGFGEMKQVPKK